MSQLAFIRSQLIAAQQCLTKARKDLPKDNVCHILTDDAVEATRIAIFEIDDLISREVAAQPEKRIAVKPPTVDEVLIDTKPEPPKTEAGKLF